MCRTLAPVLALAGSLLTITDVRSDAGAFSSFNNIVLNQTGFVFSGGPRPLVLGPGESRDFTVDYTVTVHDDGLPAPFDPRFTGCVPLHTQVCNPPYTGYEIARVFFDVGNRDGRIANPFIVLSSDTGTSVNLQTHGDPFAETLTQSGTIHFRLTNTSSFAQTDNFSYVPFAAAWVLAVPEPGTLMQLATGLVVMAALWPGFRRRSSVGAGTPSIGR